MEPEYDEFNSPIPGQSLTDEPGKWSWEKPPQHASFEEAADATMDKIFNDKSTKNIIMMLEAGLPVEGIARTIVFAGFQAGAYTVDVALLLTRLVTEAVLTIGTIAEIDNMRLSMTPEDPEQNDFEVGMADAQFIKFLSERTEKDIGKIKKVQEKEEEPTESLMSRPTQEEDE